VCASGDACQVAICSQAIEFDHSLWLPTSSTQKSSSNDVCAGNSNDVAGNKEDDGKDGNGNGDGNQGGGQKDGDNMGDSIRKEGGGQQRE
jgi:hypothetical protein